MTAAAISAYAPMAKQRGRGRPPGSGKHQTAAGAGYNSFENNPSISVRPPTNLSRSSSSSSYAAILCNPNVGKSKNKQGRKSKYSSSSSTKSPRFWEGNFDDEEDEEDDDQEGDYDDDEDEEEGEDGRDMDVEDGIGSSSSSTNSGAGTSNGEYVDEDNGSAMEQTGNKRNEDDEDGTAQDEQEQEALEEIIELGAVGIRSALSIINHIGAGNRVWDVNERDLLAQLRYWAPIQDLDTALSALHEQKELLIKR